MKSGVKIAYRVITSVSLLGLLGSYGVTAVNLIPLVAVKADDSTAVSTTANFLKQGTNDRSDAANFFDSTATLKNNNGQYQLVLTMPRGANFVQKLQIEGGQAAQIQKQANNQATVTFDLPNTSGKYTVDMNLNIMGNTMNEKADLKVDMSKLTQVSSSSSTSSNSTSTSSTSSAPTSSPSQSTKNSNSSQTGTSQATSTTFTKPLAVLNKDNPAKTSEAAGFFDKQVTVKPVGDNYQLTFHLISGFQYFNADQGVSIDGHVISPTNRHDDAANYTVTLTKAQYEKGGILATFKLAILGNQDESAYLVWDQAAFKGENSTSTSPTVVTNQNNGNVIDPNKQVQDIGYAVYKEDQGGLSDANAFYTHTAHVVKTGSSGFDVTMTIQAAHGAATFSPVSMAAGPITSKSHHLSGGKDIWTYTFHISNASALNQRTAGQILVGVPILNMPAQNYQVWFDFHGAKSGGNVSGYGTGNGTAALGGGANGAISGNTGGDITSNITSTPGAVNAAAITPFDLKAAQKLLARYAVPHGIKHRVQASLIDYPIISTMILFMLVGLGIIGGTMIWNYRFTKKMKGHYYDE